MIGECKRPNLTRATARARLLVRFVRRSAARGILRFPFLVSVGYFHLETRSPSFQRGLGLSRVTERTTSALPLRAQRYKSLSMMLRQAFTKRPSPSRSSAKLHRIASQHRNHVQPQPSRRGMISQGTAGFMRCTARKSDNHRRTFIRSTAWPPATEPVLFEQ